MNLLSLTHMLTCLASLPLLMLASGCEPAANETSTYVAVDSGKKGFWPRWSGPRSDLISREKEWSANWPKSGLRVSWEVNVGTGFSSVSVADGRLYTMGHQKGRDHVFCFDATTGKQLWSYDYRCQLVDNLHDGGPGSTPTLDGDRVYTLSREGHLFCFDAVSGEVRWSLELQEKLGIAMPEWGFTCSPLIVDEKLILEAGRTVAFDKLSGEKIWQTKVYRPGYGSPLLFQRAGKRLIAVLNNDKLLVLRLEDGSEVTTFPWTTQFATSSTTPMAYEDTLFISTGYNEGCALLRWRGDELDVVYENRNMRNHMNNCVLWEGKLYGIDGNSHNRRTCQLVCMDYATGKVAWKKRGFGCGSLMMANGYLVVLSDRGTLVLAKANPQGFEELSRTELFDARCWTVPVVVGGRVYCRSAEGDLVCAELPAKKD